MCLFKTSQSDEIILIWVETNTRPQRQRTTDCQWSSFRLFSLMKSCQSRASCCHFNSGTDSWLHILIHLFRLPSDFTDMTLRRDYLSVKQRGGGTMRSLTWDLLLMKTEFLSCCCGSSKLLVFELHLYQFGCGKHISGWVAPHLAPHQELLTILFNN